MDFPRHTEPAVAWDSRAFTYLPGLDTAVTPVHNSWTGHTRLAVVKVHPDGTLTHTLTDRVAGWDAAQVRALPLGGDGVAVVAQGKVRLLSIG